LRDRYFFYSDGRSVAVSIMPETEIRDRLAELRAGAGACLDEVDRPWIIERLEIELSIRSGAAGV
jgi:hypothetical protein